MVLFYKNNDIFFCISLVVFFVVENVCFVGIFMKVVEFVFYIFLVGICFERLDNVIELIGKGYYLNFILYFDGLDCVFVNI